MANSDQNKPIENQSVENEIQNSQLDFYSDKFDPLLALRDSTLKVPDEKAKVYDNLAIYKSAMEDLKNPRQKKEKKTISHTEIIRRWLPEQSRSYYIYTFFFLIKLQLGTC